ncbi:hypothetical protein [Planomicrobium sp. Y74]|uniref:hypothetical protein n=1 Tax=Planomicrobium sp. Y74 TaxID=2478977 RepID=UPI000EF4C612|nr:hypothetical protein [Planomicrobium sp. Y74]RLQ91315.1 hypothetical protein D9754_06190 [Planomicrobium sp. Y74]
MKLLFWVIMTGISVGITVSALMAFLMQRSGEFTIYILIAGLVMTVISAWGMKKYAGTGYFSNKK